LPDSTPTKLGSVFVEPALPRAAYLRIVGLTGQPSSTSSSRGRTLFLEGKGAYARFADYAAE